MPADVWRLLSLLWQVSWQGTLFAGFVGIFCALVRLPASWRSLLWFLVGVKFTGGLLWLLCFGTGVPLTLSLVSGASVETMAKAQGDWMPILGRGLFSIWFGGVLICLAIVLVRVCSTYRMVRKAAPHPVTALVQTLSHLGKRLGLSPQELPALRTTASTSDGPQVTLYGTHSVILFPAPFLPPSPNALSNEEIRLVLAHELAHVQRGDLWAGLFFAVTQTIFFFHPCVAWAKREWEAAREEACDLLALRACADGNLETTARYGALLLRLGGGIPIPSAGSAGITTSPYAALRRRLHHLEIWKTSSPQRFSGLSLLASPILLLLLVPLQIQVAPIAKTYGKNTIAVVPALHPMAIVPRTRVIVAALKTPPIPIRTVRQKHWMPLTAVLSTRIPTRSMPTAPITVRHPETKLVLSNSPSSLSLTPAPKPTLSAPLATVEIVSPPVHVASATPVSVTPEAIPIQVADSSTTSIVTETTSGSGGSSARSTETTAVRIPGILAEGRINLRLGRTVPTVDTTHPTLPFPLPSPSPLPEAPLRGDGVPRPIER